MTLPIIVAIARSPFKGDLAGKDDIEIADCLIRWDPAALGVHPGDSAWVYVLDFSIWPGAPNLAVRPVGLTLAQGLDVVEQKWIWRDAVHGYAEVEVRVPMLDQLQGCASYSSNPLMMWLQFRIQDPSGQQSLDSIPIVIWKPWPVIVAVSRSALVLRTEVIDAFKAMNDIERAAYLIKRDPAALGVYPGDSVFIDVLDLNAGAQGGAYHVSPVQLPLASGLTVEGQQTILSDNLYRYEELEVKVPTLDQLQRSQNYEPNAPMTGLQLQVEGPSGAKSWNSLPILVWMPWPQVKEWDWDSTLRVVRVGMSPDAPPISGGTGTEITRFLGLPSDSASDPRFGQVRWYGIKEVPDLPSAPDFINLEKTFGPAGKLVVVLPKGLQDTLSQVRNKGTWIPPLAWTDSYVEFMAPPDPGVAILWRDYLPSRPIIDIQELANQLWQVHVDGAAMSDVYYPVPVGEPFRLGVERLLDEANNVLARFLGEGKMHVEFGYHVQAYAPDGDSAHQFEDLVVINGPAKSVCDKAEDIQYDSDLDSETVGVSSQTIELRVRPKFTQQDPEKETLGKCGAFTIQLRAHIWGSFFARYVDLTLNVGLPLIFRPTPLALPTMAIFFQHTEYKGAPLVMFPKDTFGMPAELNNLHYDDRTKMAGGAAKQDDWTLVWTRIKTLIWDKLKLVHDTLQMLVDLHLADDIPYLDAVTDVMGQILAATRLVLNSTGYIADLRQAVFDFGIWEILGFRFDFDDQHFGNSISSAILVGVPYEWSKIVVNCYEHQDRNASKAGRLLQFVLPNQTFVAAVADMRYLLRPSKIMGRPVARPYGRKEENQPGEPSFSNLDDRIASIEIVTQ